MKNKVAIKLLTLCLVALAVVPALKAEYYEPDLFPVGLTGTNGTGAPYGTGPYSIQGWGWTRADQEAANRNGDKNEQELVYNLHINCIGSEDAFADYLIRFKPAEEWLDCYLHKVCIPSHQNSQIEDIMLISTGLYATPSFYKCLDYVPKDKHGCDNEQCSYHYDDDCVSGFVNEDWARQIAAGAFFRSPHRGQYGGFGSMLFTAYRANDSWGDHGTQIRDSWKAFDGDNLWRSMADQGVTNFVDYFDDNDDYEKARCLLGYNLMTEEPACYTHENQQNYNHTPWEGCWAAIDRILNGDRTKFPISENRQATHNGIRGAEEQCSAFEGKRRLIIAKGGIWPLQLANINIFESLPDLDAFLIYSEQPFLATLTYGEQTIWDLNLFGSQNANKFGIGGWHYTAIYFQQNAKTNLAYQDQKRRWIAGIGLAWYHLNKDGDRSIFRRPCPPEIRCAVYLSLSRGAKGIMFIPWSLHVQDPPKGNAISEFPNVKIPMSSSDTMNLRNDNSGQAGMRDHNGWPFGMSPSTDPTYSINHHFLNNGSGTTYWHGNPPYPTEARHDHTYNYLADTLIPEIKVIAPVLMQLDWVNGYSLNSTDPNWTSPCPHDYVADVWGVSYMDLALFDHPYEPIGVEYFMLVNREGIADMTNRTVSVALDAGHWPQEDSLVLTDIAHKDSPQTLVRQGDRYTFTQVFEPGEGKLYRVAPANAAPVAINNNRPYGGVK